MSTYHTCQSQSLVLLSPSQSCKTLKEIAIGFLHPVKKEQCHEQLATRKPLLKMFTFLLLYMQLFTDSPPGINRHLSKAHNSVKQTLSFEDHLGTQHLLLQTQWSYWITIMRNLPKNAVVVIMYMYVVNSCLTVKAI